MNNTLPCRTISISIFISFFLAATNGYIFAHSWEAPKAEAQLKNPTPFTAESINDGKAMFKELCSHCHGDNAEGLKPEETGLEKNTGNLHKRLKSHSDGDFFWKIQNGKDEMPSFSKELTENQIWDIINYIRSTGK
jgi:mono/diheme cytochrome c family protein